MKKIIGYSRYMVDENGNIKNADGKLMKQTTDRDGYKRIKLVADDGVRRGLAIHRIVYGTYNNIEISALSIIDHIDLDRNNNSISNLREVNWSVSNINKKTRSTYVAIDLEKNLAYQFDNLDLAKEKIKIDNFNKTKKFIISNNHIVIEMEIEKLDSISYFVESSVPYEDVCKMIDVDMTNQSIKQICPKIAVNNKLGKTYIYRKNSEFAEFLEGKISSVQGTLLKNTKTYKGYTIDYLPFFYKASFGISEVISTTTLK